MSNFEVFPRGSLREPDPESEWIDTKWRSFDTDDSKAPEEPL